MALPAAQSRALALVALGLAGLRIRVELLLQIPERLIRKALLLAQRVGQTLHRLTASRIALTVLALGHAQVFHHPLKLFQRLLRLGKPALFHQLLDAVHHVLQILLRHPHHVFRELLVAVLLPVSLRLLRLLAQIVLRGVAQFLHQLGDLFVAGAVFSSPRSAVPAPRASAQAHRRYRHPPSNTAKSHITCAVSSRASGVKRSSRTSVSSRRRITRIFR